MRYKQIEKKIEGLVARANFKLGKDVSYLLKQAYGREHNCQSRQALKWILENIEIAGSRKLALCQDTGMPLIFIEAGREVKIDYKLVKVISQTVTRAYQRYNLRPSIVDALGRGKPQYRAGECKIIFNPRLRNIRVTLMPKGFGSENKSRLKMFNPTADLREIEDFVVEAVKKAGPQACPPFFVGIGIGGASDTALSLAKRALLTDLRRPNYNRRLAKLENKILKRINDLDIGVMGLGGKTALAVKVKKDDTHIAGLPVGVNISCWALRRATISLSRL
jgi:fumarate hydratase subunit alpha